MAKEHWPSLRPILLALWPLEDIFSGSVVQPCSTRQTRSLTVSSFPSSSLLFKIRFVEDSKAVKQFLNSADRTANRPAT